MAATVTIDKAYFETLMRRAEFHVSGNDYSTPVDLLTVTIPKPDHDALLRLAGEYDRLRDALFRGGINAETLEVLINGAANAEERPLGTPALTDDESNGGVVFSRPAVSPGSLYPSHADRQSGRATLSKDGRGFLRAGNDGNVGVRKQSFDAASYASVDSLDKDDTFVDGNGQDQASRPQYAGRNERRTILLSNLSDRTSHQDVVGVIRGGVLLDIYMRGHERSASVSFVEGVAAQAFINYTKRNDIYIHGKRVEVRWSERQFILPNHVASKVAHNNATRNLLLRNVPDKVTEEGLRDDLEHIHNLVVIDITFRDHNAFVSLNSIHNGLFARTCMMSRTTYKGLKIEWFADECAEPLPRTPVAAKENAPPPAKRAMPVMNRFDLLNLDGSEDTSDDEVHGHARPPASGSVFDWGDTGVAV
ncbi:MAG: hypothetical protein M1832_003574 [Thelocarpon impressellum]|nr:MAG: hypothetical protein M1832_003574 [Thelocarpon impressellum]